MSQRAIYDQLFPCIIIDTLKLTPLTLPINTPELIGTLNRRAPN